MSEPDIGHVRNVAPKGRLQQRRDREYIEKNRLKKRSYGHVRHGEEIDNVLFVNNDAPAYMNTSDRLRTDACSEERQKTEAKNERSKKILQRKREERVQKEDERCTFEQKIHDKEMERLEKCRETNQWAKRNVQSEPYNIINLMYNDSLDGLRLQHADEKIKYRSKCRAQKLDNRMNSYHNPLTGEVRPQMDVGQEPQVPEQLN